MLHLIGQNSDGRDIMQNYFAPLIGVLCSGQADEICHRNNLSFVEMLQPFAKIPKDGAFSEGVGTFARGVRLGFCDVEWRPPQTVLARKMLNDSVSNAQSEKTKTIKAGNAELELPSSEPWFEQWRETFLNVQFPADHEFTRHFLSCIIVLSSTDPSIVDSAHKLMQRVQQMQNITPPKLPKWFHPTDVLNSFVILHEGFENDLSKAQQAMELVKSNFPKNKCFLLTINSLSSSATNAMPDHWAPYIKRPPKSDAQSSDNISLKLAQDDAGSAPPMHVSTLVEAPSDSDNDMVILHPLSPVQENATDALSCKFNISSESIASQITNPSAYTNETDSDGPHGNCMNASDVENVRHFVRDYTLRALMPYVELLILTLNDLVANKKGVSKSLLSATKRWFTSAKPTASSNNQNAVIYTSESSELQTRKLGDLHFMFGNYKLAFEAYHQAKRDFNADSAWQYYAGALEMAAISAFMLGSADRKTFDYMENAINCYLAVCKLQQFATRATLLSVECLKASRLYSEAAKQLIRMTNEDSHLRAALFLEQAAYCFLYTNPSMHRKYALQIALAAHRFTVAGQRKHAYRCYQQCLQVFQGRSWDLAEDHLHFKIGRHAYVLKKLDEASHSFSHLLRPGGSRNLEQHSNYLREYIKTQNELMERNADSELPSLALPQVKQDSVRVLTLLSPAIESDQYKPANDIDISSEINNEPMWQKLEEMIVITASSNKAFVFKPSRYLYTKEFPAAEAPLAIQNETIEVFATVANTIGTGVMLSNIDILWKLTLGTGEIISNSALYDRKADASRTGEVIAALQSQYNAVVKTNCVKSILIPGRVTSDLTFTLQPKLTGQLNILGIVCELAAAAEPTLSLLGVQRFEVQQIKDSSQKFNSQPQLDNRLSLKVLPKSPALSVGFTEVPANMLAGEIVPLTVSLSNLGIANIEQVYLSCDNPRWLTLLDKSDELPISVLSSLKDLSNTKLVKDKEVRRQHVFQLLQKADSNVALHALETTTIQMWLQAPYNRGSYALHLLFYYSLPSTTGTQIKYRLVRHKLSINVHECLHVEATSVVSNPMSNELGVHVSVKNNSKLNHLLATEACIESMALFSAEYKLNAKKLYVINDWEITAKNKQKPCLKPETTSSFECRLEHRKSSERSTTGIESMKELLKNRLSDMAIFPTENIKEFGRLVPALGEAHSFLVNHETFYFNSNLSTEEFNAIVATSIPHVTLAINWTATVKSDNQKRPAYGQHFVQLYGLYELSCCPQSGSQLENHQRTTLRTRSYATEELPMLRVKKVDEADLSDADDFWEPNDQCMSTRCLLEDDSFVITTKA